MYTLSSSINVFIFYSSNHTGLHHPSMVLAVAAPLRTLKKLTD